jgi:hypothetical protein
MMTFGTSDWTAGTHALLKPRETALLVVVADDPQVAQSLADGATRPEVAGLPIEVRGPFAHRTRAPGEAASEVIFVLGQLTVGAGGNALWTAVQHLWQRITMNSNPDITPQPPTTRVTIVSPGKYGTTSIKIVSTDDADALRVIKEIVQTVVQGDDGDQS